MRSPNLSILRAMLWEVWRVTRIELAWKLTLGIGGALTVLVLFAAFQPSDAANRYQDSMGLGAATALILIVIPHLAGWWSMATLNSGRRGSLLCLHYTRPVRTAVNVGLPMVYLTAVSSAIYLASALLLRLISGYAFPLLPVAAWIAAFAVAAVATTLWTRNRAIQVQVMACAAAIGFFVATQRLTAVEIPDTFDWPPRLWPTLFDFPLTDYALIALIGLVSFGVAV